MDSVISALKDIPGGILTISALALVILFVADTLHSWYRLRHVPGPFWCKFSSLWVFKHALAGKLPHDITDLTEKHGLVVRISPTNVATTDHEFIRRMSAIKSSYTRGDWYEGFKPIPEAHSTFSILDENHHNYMRSRTAPAYARDQGLEDVIDQQVKNLVKLIDTKYTSDATTYRPNDFTRTAQYFTLDVISAISLGEPYGFLTKDFDMHDFLQDMDEVFPTITALVEIPAVAKLFRTWPFYHLRPSVRDKKGFGRMLGLQKQAVDAHLAKDYKRKGDMLDIMIERGLKYQELVAEMGSFVLGGSESTASSIRMTIACLLATPTAYIKLRKEIDDNVDNFSSPIKDKEALKLPYLRACIFEGMRLYPASVASMYKKVPPEGDTVGGIFLPGGTGVATNVYGVGRRKDLWGEDAASFRPDRWLEMDEAKYKAMISVVELVFGSGKYVCLGKAIAYMELHKAIVEIFRHFDISSIDPVTPLTLKCAGFYVLNGQWLRFERRT